MIAWLEPEDDFPPLSAALTEPNGLLAASAELSVERLITAYLHGIFPWFSPGDPVLWWSPDPRMVLFPQEFQPSHSLRKLLRQGNYTVRLDSDFAAVIRACGETPRHGQNGTWITPEIIAAYSELHRLGLAHSVETWRDGKLVGGLYGVAIGKMFYGESMFAWQSNASKIAFAHLVAYLQDQGFGLIDCQMQTAHLTSLGGRTIPRQTFVQQLHELSTQAFTPNRWPETAADALWRR